MLNRIFPGKSRIACGRLAAAFLATPLLAGAAFGQSDATPASVDHSYSALTPQSQAEWQTLLYGQQNQAAVKFNDTTIPNEPLNSFARLFAWNQVALDTAAIDHTPPAAGQNYTFGQQFGPHRAARAMAIVHIAMFEAVNAVFREFRSYTGLAPAPRRTSVDLAMARAAHDALVFLYPSQQSRLDKLLAFDSRFVEQDAGSEALGQAAAASIIALRKEDGSQMQEPVVGVNFTPHGGPGFWSPDPISHTTVALGANWAQVKPFVIESASQFRPVPPPALDSQEWYDAFKKVVAVGGDPAHGTPTERTPDETLHGIFWTYDGTPNLCAPPRLYNQVARALAFQRGMPSVSQAARLLALINTAMADAAIAAWEAKWHYQFWRPVTAIRFAGFPANSPITPNPTFYPLGAQATNTHDANFTPPFPAYPSGHATIGGALFETLRAFFRDDQPFVFVSDEFNGRNADVTGHVLPLVPVTFKSLTDAEHDNAESRVWIGVHWQFDADQGVATGRRVADFVFAHAFQPAADVALR